MRGPVLLGLVCLLTALVVLAGHPGLALAAAPDRSNNGFKMGMARLHPSLVLSASYDSYAAQLTADEKAGDLILSVVPGAELELNAARVDFNLYGKASYSRYLGVVSSASTDASFVGVDAGLGLKLKVTETFSVSIDDSLKRSDQSQAPTLQVGVLSLYNDASLRLNWRPWHGNLSIEPSYHLATEIFSKRSSFDNLTCDDGFGCSGWDVSESNYLDHKAALGVRWGFLPKSALMLDVGFRARHYLGDNGTDSNSLQASVGIQSVFLPRLTGAASFGWIHEFKKIYSSPVARASLSYALTTQSKLTLGYERMLSPTPSTKWTAYSSDRVHLDANFLFAGRFALDASVSARFLKYLADDDSTKDWELGASLAGTYAVLSWLDVKLSYRLAYADHVAGINDFLRHVVTLAVEIRY